MYSNFIEIQLPNSKKVLKVAAIWLRDHCRCSECYNNTTKQRLLDLLSIPENINAVSQEIQNSSLLIHWTDGHKSTYGLNFLADSQVENYKNLQKTTPISWNTNSIKTTNYAQIDIADLVKNDEAVKEVVSSLIKYGVAFIKNVPANTDMTEMAMRKMFPVMKTLFGEMFTFMDAPDHADTAYSKDYLGSHTDNTYFCDAAGLQTLHCLFHDGTGGESFLVDGLKAVEQLKAKNPKAFEILTKIQVPAEFIDSPKGQHNMHSAPVIRINPVDGVFEQIRWNVYDRSVLNTISQQDMPAFYSAFIEFMKIIQDESNKWVFKLTPGTVMIFDNWRVLHGREKYTGLRKMTGCYVLRTEFLSKARHLNLV